MSYCAKILKCEVCALFLIDFINDPNKLILMESQGYKEEIVTGKLFYDLSLDVDQSPNPIGLSAWVAIHRESVLD